MNSDKQAYKKSDFHEYNLHNSYETPNAVDDENEETEPKRQILTKLTILCILGTELCERLTFFSVSGNLVILSTNVLGYTSADAIIISLLFVGKMQCSISRSLFPGKELLFSGCLSVCSSKNPFCVRVSSSNVDTRSTIIVIPTYILHRDVGRVCVSQEERRNMACTIHF